MSQGLGGRVRPGPRGAASQPPGKGRRATALIGEGLRGEEGPKAAAFKPLTGCRPAFSASWLSHCEPVGLRSRLQPLRSNKCQALTPQARAGQVVPYLKERAHLPKNPKPLRWPGDPGAEIPLVNLTGLASAICVARLGESCVVTSVPSAGTCRPKQTWPCSKQSRAPRLPTCAMPFVGTITSSPTRRRKPGTPAFVCSRSLACSPSFALARRLSLC